MSPIEAPPLFPKKNKIKSGSGIAWILFAIIFFVTAITVNAYEMHVINVTAKIVNDIPLIDPQGGQYCDAIGATIVLSTTMPGANIIYTTDNSDPICPSQGTIYNSPFILNTSSIVKARTCHDGTQSAVASQSFTISPSYCPVSLTCVQAKNLGLISGSINGNIATITNNSSSSYEVGLAVYKKYDETIDHQTLYDSDTGTVMPSNSLNLAVELPDCKYQIDLFCGEVLTSLNNQRYGDRKLDFEHSGGEKYCTPDKCDGEKHGSHPKNNEDHSIIINPDNNHQQNEENKLPDETPPANSISATSSNLQSDSISSTTSADEIIIGQNSDIQSTSDILDEISADNKNNMNKAKDSLKNTQDQLLINIPGQNQQNTTSTSNQSTTTLQITNDNISISSSIPSIKENDVPPPASPQPSLTDGISSSSPPTDTPLSASSSPQ